MLRARGPTCHANLRPLISVTLMIIVHLRDKGWFNGCKGTLFWRKTSTNPHFFHPSTPFFCFVTTVNHRTVSSFKQRIIQIKRIYAAPWLCKDMAIGQERILEVSSVSSSRARLIRKIRCLIKHLLWLLLISVHHQWDHTVFRGGECVFPVH